MLGSINASLSTNNTASEEFKRYAKEQKIYSRGAIPPADGQALSWAAQTFDEPNVLSVYLEPLDSLPIGDYVTEGVRTNLKMSLDTYCSDLIEEGKLKSCSMPPPDPPAPKPRVWSHWSNDRTGSDYPVQVSDLGPKIQFFVDINKGLLSSIK